MCRYRYPQVQQLRTCFKTLTKDPLPWYHWDGSMEKRLLPKRNKCDAFQNIFCPCISYSKSTYNTNLVILMPGPLGEYAFVYVHKNTQIDDTKACEKLKNYLEKACANPKFTDRNISEAMRKLFIGSFNHTASTTIRPCMAAFINRFKARFLFSHEFVWCPRYNAMFQFVHLQSIRRIHSVKAHPRPHLVSSNKK
jgi:hypothetical protein